MIVKTYGIYDGCAKEYVRTFTSQNDDVAQRAAKYIVREKGFDPIAGRDFIITHLFDFDSTDGRVVDNDVHAVCNLAAEIDLFEKEKKEVEMMNLLSQLKGKEQDVKQDSDTNGKKGS